MNDFIHPVVQVTLCLKCQQRFWRKVNERVLWDGTQLELYECANALCPGVRETEGGREPWPLSWAYKA